MASNAIFKHASQCPSILKRRQWKKNKETNKITQRKIDVIKRGNVKNEGTWKKGLSKGKKVEKSNNF